MAPQDRVCFSCGSTNRGYDPNALSPTDEKGGGYAVKIGTTMGMCLGMMASITARSVNPTPTHGIDWSGAGATGIFVMVGATVGALIGSVISRFVRK
jgi:hypothetical protein